LFFKTHTHHPPHPPPSPPTQPQPYPPLPRGGAAADGSTFNTLRSVACTCLPPSPPPTPLTTPLSHPINPTHPSTHACLVEPPSRPFR
jgi:hypothetical protein